MDVDKLMGINKQIRAKNKGTAKSGSRNEKKNNASIKGWLEYKYLLLIGRRSKPTLCTFYEERDIINVPSKVAIMFRNGI